MGPQFILGDYVGVVGAMKQHYQGCVARIIDIEEIQPMAFYVVDIPGLGRRSFPEFQLELVSRSHIRVRSA